jgi:hypothetical protein
MFGAQMIELAQEIFLVRVPEKKITNTNKK